MHLLQERIAGSAPDGNVRRLGCNRRGTIMANIVGTNGDDILFGTDEDDIIRALAGDDEADGLGGQRQPAGQQQQIRDMV